MSFTLPRLTSLSTQTLTLLLERQRLQSLSTVESSISLPSSSLAQITRNLNQLRAGIYALEEQESNADVVRMLREQYVRMRDMLGVDKDQVELLREPVSYARDELASELDPVSTPYKDDPDSSPYHDAQPNTIPFDTADVLESQRLMMNEQDTRLDLLHSSLTRQHHISQELSSELDVHAGLLTELDTEIDNTTSRLGRARRALDRVGRGVGANGSSRHTARELNNLVLIGSTISIAGLILVLLILIAFFKT